MKTLKFKSLSGGLLLLAALFLISPSDALANENSRAGAMNAMSPQGDAQLSLNAARVLRRLAAAQRDIFQKNIHGAQDELGQALGVVDQMKSRLLSARLQELIAGARIRLTYEDPKQVRTYLELITPTLEDIQDPAALKEIKQRLQRAEGFLDNGDKEAAARELQALMDAMVYQTAARPIALAEKHLLNAASELDKQRGDNAKRAIAAAENTLNPIAFGEYLPLAETLRSLRQAVIHHALGRWVAVKTSLERATRASENALKDAKVKGRDELQNLDVDIKTLLAKSTQSGENAGRSIKGLWERGVALADRALDYQTAAWEKFQASRSDADDLINAKLHVAYAEIYEFTTGETEKSAKELDEAETYLKNAAPRLRSQEEAELETLQKDLQNVKAAVGKQMPQQRERYAAIKDGLSSLIH